MNNLIAKAAHHRTREVKRALYIAQWQCNIPVAHIEYLKGGISNDNFLVITKSGERYVLKMARDNRKFGQTCNFSEYLRRNCPIPIPEVLCHFDATDLHKRSYILMRMADGTPLNTITNLKNLGKLVSDLGRILAMIHNCTQKSRCESEIWSNLVDEPLSNISSRKRLARRFLPLSLGKKLAYPFVWGMIASAAKGSLACSHFDGWSQSIIDETRGRLIQLVLSRRISIFEAKRIYSLICQGSRWMHVEDPCILHGDYTLSNVLTNGKKITAILDLENFRVGDAEFELERAGEFNLEIDFGTTTLYERSNCDNNSGRLAEKFLAAYTSVRTLSASFHRKRIPYLLSIVVDRTASDLGRNPEVDKRRLDFLRYLQSASSVGQLPSNNDEMAL